MTFVWHTIAKANAIFVCVFANNSIFKSIVYYFIHSLIDWSTKEMSPKMSPKKLNLKMCFVFALQLSVSEIIVIFFQSLHNEW